MLLKFPFVELLEEPFIELVGSHHVLHLGFELLVETTQSQVEADLHFVTEGFDRNLQLDVVHHLDANYRLVLLHVDLQFSKDFFDLRNLLALPLQHFLGDHSLTELELQGLMVSELSFVVSDQIWVVGAIPVVSQMHNC